MMPSMKYRVLLTALAFLALVCAGCTTMPPACIDGSGTIITEERTVPEFRSVSLSMPAVLTVRTAGPPAVQITADDNVLPLIGSTVRNGALSLAYTRPCVRPTSAVQVSASASNISELSILGTGDIRTDGVIRGSELKSSITGTGSMDLAAEVSLLESTITGTGTMVLTGSADDLTISIPGAGTVDASGLAARRVTVEILGSGNALVDVTDSLSVKIMGSGSVAYSGNPATIEQSVTGSGSIRKVG
jgi:hypothetical protein